MDNKIKIFILFIFTVTIIILMNCIKYLVFRSDNQILSEQHDHIIKKMKGKTGQSEENIEKSKHTANEPDDRGKKDEIVKMKVEREAPKEYEGQGASDEFPYKIWELEEAAKRLEQEAGDLMSSAIQLSEEGYEAEAMEYEEKAMELEARAVDLMLKYEDYLQELQDEEEGQEIEIEGNKPGKYEEQAGSDEFPYETWELEAAAKRLEQEAGVCLSSAIQLIEEGYEAEAKEYEEKAMELEAQADDLRLKYEDFLQELQDEKDSQELEEYTQ